METEQVALNIENARDNAYRKVNEELILMKNGSLSRGFSQEISQRRRS